MALTTVQTNNKLIQFQKDINREFVRENMFSPYMSEGLTAVIRRVYDAKQGGEQVNIPLVTKLTNTGVGVGTLVGNEEKIENYGMRMWVDWARNAVTTNAAEEQKDSADIFGEAKPLLSDWGKELQRDEIIAAMHALPSESAQAALGSAGGGRVNGLLYEATSDAQRNTWVDANEDRILYGNAISNLASVSHATDLAKIDASADRLTTVSIGLMKQLAVESAPAIRPFKTKNGYEHYVCFAGSRSFFDLKASLATANQAARPREDGWQENPYFQDGDLLYDGVIIRQVPEISGFVTDVWTDLVTAGDSSNRVEPVFFCGQQAVAFAWAQMAKPTFRKEDDYGFVRGVGVEMAYGVAKMFKKHPASGSNLKQWGVVTGYFNCS